ncbi:MAG TPA: hypothetical protein VIE65_10230 [Methylobacter sp.]
MTALESPRSSAHNAIMAEKHPKRPRDLNQWAKRMLDIAHGRGKRRRAHARGTTQGPCRRVPWEARRPEWRQSESAL